MKLTPHFSLAELTVTNTGLPNDPLPEHIAALQVTAFGMENVRHICGDRPCIITSGYRSPAVNAKVGGVANSAHALGYAADFHVMGMTGYRAAKSIAESPLVFDQLILERGNTTIHISFDPRLRRQILRQPGGPGTPFYTGLD